MTKLEQLRDPLCFAGWLRQITVRMALNRLTRKGRKAPSRKCCKTLRQRGRPLHEIIQAENRSLVSDGLDKLKEFDRDTLVAFYIKGRIARADGA